MRCLAKMNKAAAHNPAQTGHKGKDCLNAACKRGLGETLLRLLLAFCQIAVFRAGWDFPKSALSSCTNVRAGPQHRQPTPGSREKVLGPGTTSS